MSRARRLRAGRDQNSLTNYFVLYKILHHWELLLEVIRVDQDIRSSLSSLAVERIRCVSHNNIIRAER